jgi:excisionase family DNA binding protein
MIFRAETAIENSTPTQARPDKLLTIKDAAEILNFSVRQIARWLRSGQIASLRFGRDVRINPAEIEKIKGCGLTNGNNLYYVKADSAVLSRVSRRKGRRRLWDT